MLTKHINQVYNLLFLRANNIILPSEKLNIRHGLPVTVPHF